MLIAIHLEFSQGVHDGAIQDGQSIMPHGFSAWGRSIPESTHKESGSE